MTEALSTTAVYTITEEPTYADDNSPQTALSIGQKVKVMPYYETPDEDGDVKVRPVDDPDMFPKYVRASCLTKEASTADFPVGTRVRVAADAETPDGYSVYFGAEIEGVVIEPHGGYPNDVNVRRDGEGPDVRVQLVAPAFLTKIEEPEEDEKVSDEVAEEPRPADSEVVSVVAIQKAHAFLIDKGDSESTEALIELAKLIEAGV